MARKPKITADERRWRAQDALSTLTRAESIRSDKTLMADVKKYATQQVQTLTKVTGTPARPAAKAPKTTRKR